ncbi:hypothetical protein I2I05_08195 [Hymenobacter sp. BT683]|uniref:Uncharacterized protein n=1 Tax=Hymenobacter jeongseonensis TaxID=2791027 RepID=A0ABS0IG92_9BACT|nr:DUF6565 domain-containing protein [Hymenobacter jeongseonensis]MBF9237376.1 hypothetical protein [Hymenobacter jeongseonensis]
MLRRYFTLHTLAALLLVGGGAFTQTSCTSTEKKEVVVERDQAYNDFETFVSQTEANAAAVASEAEADYESETTQLKADYDAKVAAIDRYTADYDENRRQEIEKLRTRYSTAIAQRESTWANRASAGAATTAAPLKVGKYYKPTQPATQLTAANARATYEAFVQNVKQNEERYDLDDWRYINAEWRALDEAYDKIKGDIPANDLAEIQKEKLKYAAFKSWDKTQGRAAQGANAVSNEAQEVKVETADERSKVGQAVSNTASDVKQAGKKAGGAVKDVFDGKDDKKD